MGEKITLPKNKLKQPCAAHLLISKHSGTLKSIDIPNEILNHPDLCKISIDKEPGDNINKFKVGPDRLGDIVVKANSAIEAEIRAKEFVEEILVKKLKIKQIIIGYDHRFGRDREASVEDLKKFSLDYMFTVNEIPAQEIDSIAISSTKIRDAILNGEIEKCNEFLGRNFMLTGKVVYGEGLGKKINFPTANIEIKEPYKIIPKDGVYLVRTILNSGIYFGMMNIGVRPTIGGKGFLVHEYASHVGAKLLFSHYQTAWNKFNK